MVGESMSILSYLLILSTYDTMKCRKCLIIDYGNSFLKNLYKNVW